MTDTRDDKEFVHFEYIVGPGERAAFMNGRASRDAEVATLSRQLAEAQTISKQRLSALEFVRSERDKLHHKLAAAQTERDALSHDLSKVQHELDAEHRRLSEAQAVIERQKRVIDWVESWVSHPVGSYSVLALDGLFGMTRDKIAAQTAAYRTGEKP